MYEYGAEDDRLRMRFDAMCHGIDIDKIEREGQEETAESMLFRDPADYEKMPEEEREELTRKMTMHHKGWIKKSKSMVKGQ